jgi:hypothetical protein
LLQFGSEFVALLFDCAERLGHGKLAGVFALFKLGFQLLDFGLFRGGSLLRFVGGCYFCEFDGVELVLFGQFEALM